MPASSLQPTFTVDCRGAAPLDSEWLLTNGTGAFAMGTPAGCNTRRYHALLIAATRPPVDRINTLNSLDETLHFDGQSRQLATHEFGSSSGGGSTTLNPHGFHHLLRFDRTPTSATWHYRVGSILLTKTLMLMWKRQLATLTYTIDFDPHNGEPTPDRITLSLRPLLAMRDFHSLRAAHSDPPFNLAATGRSLHISSANIATFHMSADRGRFLPSPDWWHNFHYRQDLERGQDHKEALYTPGSFDFTFSGSQPQTMTMMFGIQPIEWQLLDSPDPREAHLKKLLKHTRRTSWNARDNSTLPALTAATDDFIVDRRINHQPSTTIIAGYPWFSDWGRDTMISLPGCLLATGRFDEARQTLATFAANVSDGLIPNRFDDYGGDPHYNTVDAPLWFIHAAVQYLTTSGDKKTWTQQFAPACMSIIENFRRGTRYDIHADSDMLITAGSPTTQLTWMDAARDGVIFTPRWGKAVEINGLWYNALLSVAQNVNIKSAAELKKLAATVKRNFAKTFWDNQLGYLIDHINPYGRDKTLRPNQVFAVSLPHSPLTPAKQKQVMQVLRDRLLTPMGLRTLPQSDPNYHPHYIGSMFERDRAYHQGTVWPWLIGPFIEGWLRANKFTKKSRAQSQQFIQPLLNHLMTTGLGQLHEIFDADPPHSPQGCPAQAWSIAQLLHASLLIESKI